MLKQLIASSKPALSRVISSQVGRDPLSDAFVTLGSSISLKRNEEVYGEGEPTEYVYKITRGVVRISRLLSDGRRQISGFLLAGDVFGFENTPDHHVSAEAVSNVTLSFIGRQSLVDLAHQNGEIASSLWALTQEELGRAHEHMVVLGRKSAHERIAAFLIEMSERADAPDAVELPMSRLDIADYLGLTIETVSRTLTLFESAATIQLDSTRLIRLTNRAALARLNS